MVTRRETTEREGRELNAPSLEAPRSALEEDAIKPRPMARARRGFFQVKIRGFLVKP
jgi:hypothetical protein